ncbi:MAG: DUF4268 domain-containing protein [Ferruginibacter sp.]
MYSRQESSLLSQQFWTAFGGYLAPLLSAEGHRINWINYKTGEKDVRFIMTAGTVSAKISINLSHKDTLVQKLYFDKFLELQSILQRITFEEWNWSLLTTGQDGKVISEIYATLNEVTYLNKEDWPAIISFLKPRLIALDKFWCEHKYTFEGLIHGKSV